MPQEPSGPRSVYSFELTAEDAPELMPAGAVAVFGDGSVVDGVCRTCNNAPEVGGACWCGATKWVAPALLSVTTGNRVAQRPARRGRVYRNGSLVSDDNVAAYFDLRELRQRMQRRYVVISPYMRHQRCGKRAMLKFNRNGIVTEVAIVDGVHLKRWGASTVTFTGLETCKSVWCCPECSERIIRLRREELRTIVTRQRADGGQSYMLTLTIPHSYEQSLDVSMRVVSHAYTVFQRSRLWRDLAKMLGKGGTVRAHEITHSDENGWHPHLHVLVLFGHALDADETAGLDTLVRWHWRRSVQLACKSKKLRRDLGDATALDRYRLPSLEHGASFDVSRNEEYVAKLGLADELTGAFTKAGRTGHRTPFQILRDITVAYERLENESTLSRSRRSSLLARRKRDIALWQEYEEGVHGKRQLTYSVGLVAKYGIVEDDEQLDLLPNEAADGMLTLDVDLTEWWDDIEDDAVTRGRLVQMAADGCDAEAIVDYVQLVKYELTPAPFSIRDTG